MLCNHTPNGSSEAKIAVLNDWLRDFEHQSAPLSYNDVKMERLGSYWRGIWRRWGLLEAKIAVLEASRFQKWKALFLISKALLCNHTSNLFAEAKIAVLCS
jgi:hypothetical protein